MNSTSRSPDTFDLRMRTVLLIDDESANLGVLSTYLENLNLKVLVARDGEGGLDKARYTQPDLILLNVRLPGIDGFETCRRLKADDTTQDIPVIFMTMLTSTEDKIRGFEAGGVDYIAKPFEQREVMARVLTHLRLGDLTRQLQQAKENLEKRVEERTAQLAQVNQELHREIAERSRVEKTLIEERNLLHTLMDNLPDYIYVKDIGSRFIMGNIAVARLMGATKPDKLVGKTDFNFYPPELAEQYYADEQGVIRSGQPLIDREEPAIDQTTGHKQWLSTTKVPVRDNRGQIVGLVGMSRDISERKRLEQQVRESLERRTRQVQTSTEVAQQIAGIPRLDDLFRRVVDLVQAQFGYYHVQVYALIEGEMVLEAGTGEVGRRLKEMGHKIPLTSEKSVVVRAVWEGEPVLVPDVLQEPTWLPNPLLPETRAELAVLINLGVEVIGVLDVQSDRVGGLGEEDQLLLLGLCGQIAVAIDYRQTEVQRRRAEEELQKYRDHLEELVEARTAELQAANALLKQEIAERQRAEAEIQRRNRELALLNRVIAASVTETEPEVILEIACRKLALAFDVPQAAAALLNTEKAEARVVAEYLAPGRPSGLGRTIPVEGNPSFQYLLSHKTPLVVDDAQNDPRLAAVHDLMQQRGTVSLLIIPLLIEGEVVGSLGLDALEPRQFSAEEVNLAGSVANQVAGVLARLRLDEAHRRLEAQYYQVQKMEAIGRLTGGVAHDFNNILTVIMGNCSLILNDLGQSHPLRRDIEQIQKAAERAASLTRQLLASSRQQVLQPSILNLNGVVTNIEKMLHRLIGEDIELVSMLEPQLGQVKADPSQLEQVIMNLAVNARDAMPEGGRLTIETANVYLDEAYTRQHVGVIAGPYVMLAVSDTGLGMDAETQAHIFEPFFTTKAQGKGTGLGLATVYGIVNQSGGHIWVYSELAHGTTIKIYLPQTETTAELVKPARAAAPSGRGWETILLVEDEAMVRELAHRVLFRSGYTVLTAKNGVEARQVCTAHQGPIHLLLTDVVMPGGLSGSQVAQELMLLRPAMKVLYMSGYTDNAIVRHRVLDLGIAFLSKPFAPADLIGKVREVLDTPEGSETAAF